MLLIKYKFDVIEKVSFYNGVQLCKFQNVPLETYSSFTFSLAFFPDVLWCLLLCVKAHQPALGSFNSQAFTSVDKWLNRNQVCRPFQERVKMLIVKMQGG